MACWLQNNLGRKVLMSFYSWAHWGTEVKYVLTLWTSWRGRFLNQAFASGVLELSHDAVMSFWHYTRFKIKVKCVRSQIILVLMGLAISKQKQHKGMNVYLHDMFLLVSIFLRFFSVHQWCLNPLEKSKTIHRAQSGSFEMLKN